jgi:hypothetical protein
MKAKAVSGVMIAIALATTIGVTPILLQLQSAFSGFGGGVQNDIKKPL